MARNFHNLYTHDFARVAVAAPVCRIADPAHNAAQTIALAAQAAAQGAALVAFPELGLSAYTCDDLFHQRALLDGVLDGLDAIVAASAQWKMAVVVGAPLRVEHQLYNCAVVIAGGQIQGVVPKSYLPNYGEFYDARQFSSGDYAVATEIDLLGERVQFGSGLLFEVADLPLFKFHVEICEDVWVPIPPSSFAALAGATVLVNLSASNALVGKAGYRNQLVSQQSARCIAAYLYTSAGGGESTTDLAWDGQGVICENGELLAEAKRFVDAPTLTFADIDLERLSRERMRMNTFAQSVQRHAGEVGKFRTVFFQLELDMEPALALKRCVERFPYVPADARRRDERCNEVYNIQVQALAQRLTSSGLKKVVIGISGGLDSTHALLVCARVMDKLKLPRTNILAYTMPGFATSERTLTQAHQLMKLVGCSAQEIDIRPSCIQMLKDLNHPYAEGKEQYDITFENVQAGERTNHLFRLANHHGGLVIGTGDLSELALGWCTYGVGDQMSHYAVNAGVPKTLIQFLIRWCVKTDQFDRDTDHVLEAILGTEISPELVPAGADGAIQSTEARIGPYALNDFFLHYVVRHGMAPSKIAFLALHAWRDAAAGRWPRDFPPASRRDYDLPTIRGWLEKFLIRFFVTSQFKRSAIPNGPKVSAGGALSPRGDWRAPSDGTAKPWLDELSKNLP